MNTASALAAVFPGASAMAVRCRAFDWAATPLGPVATWPSSLRTTAATVLATGFPAIVLWGPDLVQLYNNAYIPILGVKHPGGLGLPTRVCWPEAWDFNAPIYARVLAGETVTLADQLYRLARHGPDAPLDDVYLTLSYAPVPDDTGAVAGVLVTLVETTAEVARRAVGAERAAQAEALQATAAQLAQRTDEAEAALAVSEARFRAVQDASPHGVVLMRPVRDPGAAGADQPEGPIVDFRFTYANPAGGRIGGHTPAEMVGRRLAELYPATVAYGLFAAYVRVAETGAPFQTEMRYEADGLDSGLGITAVRVGDRIEDEVAMTYADVSARLRAEAERARLLAQAAAERERLRAVVLHTPAPMALHVGPEHRYAFVNDAYRRISSGGRDVTGLAVRTAFPELAGQGIFETIDRVYATGEAWAAPETLIRYDRDGTGIQDAWFNLRLEPLRDADGRVDAVLNFSFDVTEQVRSRRTVEAANAQLEDQQVELELTNQQLQDQTAELEMQAEELQATAAELEAQTADAEAARMAAEAANQAKSQFLANMSHELRTPLNAIGGYVQLLEMELHGPVTPDQRASLGRVQAAQHRLLALINDILNYAKLESGRVEYDVRAVDVRAVIADVVPLVQPQLTAKGLAFDVRLPDGPCVAWADRDKLGQVLLNLLSNAAKFTDVSPTTGAPGRVTLDIAVRDTGPGPRGPDAGHPDTLFLRVTDTGRGIPRDRQDAIFEPFVQVRTGYAQATEGTGLGLAISRDLARGMGGDLRVRSAPGAGATFTVALRRSATRE